MVKLEDQLFKQSIFWGIQVGTWYGFPVTHVGMFYWDL